MSLKESLARLEGRWGAERVRAALLAAGRRGRHERLRLARGLLAKGLLEESVREVARALEAEPPEPAASLIGSVQVLLAARGWSVRPAKRGERVALEARRRADERVLASFVLESRGLAASRRDVSVTPVFHLRRIPLRAGRRLSAREEAGLGDLATALCLLLESLRGQAGGEGMLVQAETHEGGGEGVERILRITSACNHRCPFCFIPGREGGAEASALERELDVLADGLAPGGALVLSGGEPTVDPRLPELIASARRRGIRRFVLQTNGVLLARPGMIEELLELGVEAFDVSFHSHRPGPYGRITGSRGNHPKVVEGLGRLLASGRCRVTACVLINAWNYRELPELVGFLGGLSRERRRDPESRFEICFALMNGAGMNAAPRMAVDLREAAPYLRRALDRCREEGVLAQRFTGETAIPPCQVQDAAAYAGEVEFSQERVRYAEDFSGETGSVGRAKRPACRKCAYDARCLGVPAEYARMFGLGALSCPAK